MLDKDPVKRPSIWDLSNTPCIKSRINDLIEEQQCQDQVACIFEYQTVKEEEKKQEPEVLTSVFDVDKLDVLAHLIRSDVRIQENKGGWFSDIEKCASGLDIVNWVKNHAEQVDKKAIELCQKMLDLKVITRIDGNLYFEGSPQCLFKFYED